jgi:ribosome-associated translation inhibitor RaiA
MSMHIVVVNNIAASTEQTRAYAEYRVFTTLAPYSRLVIDVEVCLGSDDGDATHVLCSVKVQTASGKGIRIRARGRHPYDAINRAADRIGERLWEHAAAAQACS